LEETQKALHTNQTQTDEIVSAIASGKVQEALWDILNDKAAQLRIERARLMTEQRQLKEELTPLDENYNADSLRRVLSDFVTLAKKAEFEELQQLLRFTVRRIEWNAVGNHRVQIYHLPKNHCLPSLGAGRQWLYIDTPIGSP
jgi:hypothetical protein